MDAEDDISDEDLMMSYSAGDAEAFEILYQRHKGSLYRFILRQCGSRMTDELFQDIWLKVIKTRENYQVSASFKTWLYHIARNRIIDQYRRDNIRPVDNHSDELETIESTMTPSPEKSLHTKIQHEHLLDAISDLPAEQKEAFLLREEAGLSVEQIAQTCGINFETAKSRLRYATKKLQQALQDKTGEKA
jgi:RNA polymerase sigma-70 factor (ECF subfamily)